MTLTVVPPVDLYPNSNPSVSTLYDKIQAVIDDHCQNSPVKVTSAEVVGTIEFIKLANMKVYD